MLCLASIPPTTTFQAFGDADAATTGTARRGRPPTPPVLRIGPAINDISLQRLGKSCPVVKAHFDTAADRAYDTIKSAVIDVTSETVRYLIDRPKNRGKTAHVYAVLYKSNHSLKKFGLTRCLDERIKVEYEKDDSVYVVSVFNFDAMQPEMDAALRSVLNEFLDTVIDDEEADSFSRSIFKIIRDDGLGRAGAFKRMALALCERGIQLKMGGSGQTCECIMNDVATRKARRDMVRDAVDSLVARLGQRGLHPDSGATVEALSSWRPATVDMRSSQIDATRGVVGNSPITNAIDEPVVPNATTIDEMYRHDYPPPMVEAGRKVVTSGVERAAAADPCGNLKILVLDENKDVCFEKKGELDSIIGGNGFIRFPFPFMGDEASVFVKTKAKSVILKHKPLGVAGDARSTSDPAIVLKRGYSTGALRLIVKLMSAADPNEGPCPFDAADAAEYVHQALHQDWRLRAATFRHVVTDLSVNAITETNLQLHSPDPNYPLSMNSRYKYHYASAATIEERRALVAETSLTSRVHATTVVDDAISALTQAGPNYLSCVPGIDAIFKTAGDASHGLASKRWAILFSLFEEGSPPREALVEERKTKLLRNVGNANAHHTDQEEVEKNCQVFRQIMDMGIGSAKPKKKGLFFVPDDSRPIPDDMPTELSMTDYTNTKYPVFRMKFQAINTRLNKLPKHNTNANKAVRWEDIDDGIVKTKRKIATYKRANYKGGTKPIFTRKYEGYVYRLCYLEVDKILTEEEKK